jgi:hypothetical protein
MTKEYITKAHYPWLTNPEFYEEDWQDMPEDFVAGITDEEVVKIVEDLITLDIDYEQMSEEI